MEFRSTMFAIIVFGVVITAVGISVNEWSTAYGSGVVYDLGEYDKSSDIASFASEQKGSISPNDPDPGNDAEANTFRGAFGILASIYEPFRLVFGDNGMIDSITERFGAPDFVRQALVSLFIVSITFALIAVVFRLNRTSA